MVTQDGPRDIVGDWLCLAGLANGTTDASATYQCTRPGSTDLPAVLSQRGVGQVIKTADHVTPREVMYDYMDLLSRQPGFLALGYAQSSPLDGLEVFVVVDEWDSPSEDFAYEAADTIVERYSERGVGLFFDLLVVAAEGDAPEDIIPHGLTVLSSRGDHRNGT